MIGITSRYSVPMNGKQNYFLQMNKSTLVSEFLTPYSFFSSPSITPSIRQATAPPEIRSALLTEISSHNSIPTSPNTITSIQQPTEPTAPPEKFLKYKYDKRNFENNQINPKQYHNFGNDR